MDDDGGLRRRAEDLRDQTGGEQNFGEWEALRLVEELQVHQIELEMQNEELRHAKAETAAGLERYTALYDFAPVGYLTVDCNGNILRVNTTAANMIGKYRYHCINKKLGQFISPSTLKVYNAFLAKAFECQHETSCEVILEQKTGSPIYVRLDASSVIDSKDCQIAIINITEHKDIERRQLLASDIMSILNEPGDLVNAIKRVLDAIQQETGFDAVGMRLKRGEEFPYFVQTGFSDGFVLSENTIVVSDNNGVCKDKYGNVRLECNCGLVISGETDPTNALFTPGGSWWTNNVFSLYLTVDQDPRLHLRKKCIREGFLSIALIPIRTDKEIIGLLQLNDLKANRLTIEMIRYFEEVCRTIGLVLTKKQAEEALQRTAERDRHIADVLQQAVMPSQTPAQPDGYEIATRYQPAMAEADICGDFCDIFDLDNGRIGIAIGDVTGKGLSAALRVSAVRNAIRCYAYLDDRPSSVMSLVNDALNRSIMDEGDMLTACFAVLDPKSGVVTYCNAGHEPPVLWRSEAGKEIERLDVGGPMFIGLGKQTYLEGSVSLDAGDVLVMVTDGITEARMEKNLEMFGSEGLMRCLSKNAGASADQIADNILNDARRFAGGELSDDVAIVIVKETEGNEGWE